MMFTFTISCFSLFVCLVQAIPLTSRDVFNPPITSPDANTIWTVGSTQTVTWETANIPPDSQLTRTTGMVVLGWMANDSLNLQLNNPLAKDFKLRDGKVDITVPLVPTRDDYIVVLFGDSGNSSPEFVIQGGSAAPSGTPSSSSSTAPAPGPTSTLITTPIPITGSVITGGSSDSSTAAITSTPELPATESETSSALSVTVTGPILSTSFTGLPDSTSQSSSSASTQTSQASTNAAWSFRRLDSTKLVSTGMAFLVFVLSN